MNTKLVVLSLVGVVSVSSYLLAERTQHSEVEKKEQLPPTKKEVEVRKLSNLNPFPEAVVVPKTAPAVKREEETVKTPASADDPRREEAVGELLRTDKSLGKVAEVVAVKCTEDGACIAELEAKEEGVNVQMPMLDFLRTHPEYGLNFKIVEDQENPRLTYFTFSKEKL